MESFGSTRRAKASTPLYARVYPPTPSASSPPAQATTELGNQLPHETSSGHGGAIGEGTQVDSGRSPDSEVARTALVDDTAILPRHGATVDRREDTAANSPEGTPGTDTVVPRDLMAATTAAAPEQFIPIPEISRTTALLVLHRQCFQRQSVRPLIIPPRKNYVSNIGV